MRHAPVMQLTNQDIVRCPQSHVPSLYTHGGFCLALIKHIRDRRTCYVSYIKTYKYLEHESLSLSIYIYITYILYVCVQRKLIEQIHHTVFYYNMI